MIFELLGHTFHQNQKILISSKENDNVEYVSTIHNITSQRIIITMPLLDQIQMPLSVQQELYIKAETDSSVIGFICNVSSFLYGNVTYITLSLPTKYNKIDRRKSFRIETLLKTHIALLNTNTERTPAFNDGTALNLSTTGMQIVCSNYYAAGDSILIKFDLESDRARTAKLSIKAKVVRIAEEYPNYSLATEFIDVKEKDSDIITRYIFKKLISNFTDLDNVISQTLSAIENGKKQVFDITEESRFEYQRLKKELRETRNEVEKLLTQVDKLTNEEKKARLHLATVSKNFNTYNEEDIKKSYDKAREKQIELTQLRGQENLLRFKRDNIERSLRKMDNLINKADALASQFSVITNYLAGNIMDLSRTYGEMKQAQQLGISIIKAQEEERRRLSRDIHDGPAQLMANIVMRAEFCLKLMDVDQNRVRVELFEMQDMVRQCLKDVRKIIFDLRPMVLDDLGLVPAVKRYIEEFKENCSTEVELLVIGESKRLPTAIEVAVFRVIQESLNNIRKHAKAQNAMIKIEVTENRINVVIKDDGVGFNFEHTINNREREDFGLLGMRERIQILDGSINFNTSPGLGTTITISLKYRD